MKKNRISRLLAITVAGSMILAASVSTMAEADGAVAETVVEEADAPEETSESEADAEELRVVGAETEDAYIVELHNATGKEIKGIEIKEAEDEDYPENGNLLELGQEEEEVEGTAADAAAKETPVSENVIGAEEKFILSYDAVAIEALLTAKDDPEAAEDAETTTETSTDVETTAETDAQAEADEEAPVVTIRITFADEKTAELHEVSLADMEKAELSLEGDIAYLIYESLADQKEVNTLEAEQALAAAENTVYAGDYSYDGDYSYGGDYTYDGDYSYGGSDTSSEDIPVDTTGDDTNGNVGGDDSCLDDGLVFGGDDDSTDGDSCLDDGLVFGDDECGGGDDSCLDDGLIFGDEECAGGDDSCLDDGLIFGDDECGGGDDSCLDDGLIFGDEECAGGEEGCLDDGLVF